jgi:predicted nucleic acid-binding protein
VRNFPTRQPRSPDSAWRLFAALRRAGTPIPVNDIWIAATALDQGGCLPTFDSGFRQVAHLDSILLEGIGSGTED